MFIRGEFAGLLARVENVSNVLWDTWKGWEGQGEASKACSQMTWGGKSVMNCPSECLPLAKLSLHLPPPSPAPKF